MSHISPTSSNTLNAHQRNWNELTRFTHTRPISAPKITSFTSTNSPLATLSHQQNTSISRYNPKKSLETIYQARFRHILHPRGSARDETHYRFNTDPNVHNFTSTKPPPPHHSPLRILHFGAGNSTNAIPTKRKSILRFNHRWITIHELFTIMHRFFCLKFNQDDAPA